MIRVGDPLDVRRRHRVAVLVAAVIGDVPGRDQLARERVIALAPGHVVTEALADYVTRAMAIATPRCAVCFEPGIAMHAVCAVLHAEQLAAAQRSSSNLAGPRRRR